MQSQAATVEQYLAELTPERQRIVGAVREVIIAHLDPDIEEGMGYGMIGYAVPHRVYPAGYHCNPKQPLPYAAIASQKQYVSVYLMGIYTGGVCGSGAPDADWFRQAWEATGRKANIGACCVRFKRLEDCALDVIGEAIRRLPARDYIARYEAERAAAKAGKRR
jgi:hypothetical protein